MFPKYRSYCAEEVNVSDQSLPIEAEKFNKMANIYSVIWHAVKGPA